ARKVLRGLVPGRINCREAGVTPQSALRAKIGRRVAPGILCVTEHQAVFAVDVPIGADLLLAGRYRSHWRRHPVVNGIVVRGQRVQLHQSQSRRAQLVLRDRVVRESISSEWICGSRPGVGVRAAEVALAFQESRNGGLAGNASKLAAPLLRPEEEDLILLDRASNGISEVVESQLCLICFARIKEEVRSIQRI